MNKRWKSSLTNVYNLGYHVIWCTKYRRKVLTGNIEMRLKELIIQKSDGHGWVVDNMEVMPDHIHIFIKCTPTDSPSYIVSQLKGYTSNLLRREFMELKTKLPTLWTRSFYVESVGRISETTIKKYIDTQKSK